MAGLGPAIQSPRVSAVNNSLEIRSSNSFARTARDWVAGLKPAMVGV